MAARHCTSRRSLHQPRRSACAPRLRSTIRTLVTYVTEKMLMFLRNLFQGWARRQPAPRSSHRVKSSFRPGIESLEGRVVPAVISITQDLNSHTATIHAARGHDKTTITDDQFVGGDKLRGG